MNAKPVSVLGGKHHRDNINVVVDYYHKFSCSELNMAIVQSNDTSVTIGKYLCIIGLGLAIPSVEINDSVGFFLWAGGTINPFTKKLLIKCPSA